MGKQMARMVNLTKSQAWRFSRKLNKHIHPPYTCMYEQPISEVSSHKHLGVTLSSDCTWHLHINSIKEKTWKRVNIMRKLKYTLDRESFETIYVSFIRNLLEYGDVISKNCRLSDKQEFYKIQNEAARIVSGTTELVSINHLYLDVVWESLESRTRNHKFFLFYKNDMRLEVT